MEGEGRPGPAQGGDAGRLSGVNLLVAGDQAIMVLMHLARQGGPL